MQLTSTTVWVSQEIVCEPSFKGTSQILQVLVARIHNADIDFQRRRRLQYKGILERGGTLRAFLELSFIAFDHKYFTPFLLSVHKVIQTTKKIRFQMQSQIEENFSSAETFRGERNIRLMCVCASYVYKIMFPFCIVYI